MRTRENVWCKYTLESSQYLNDTMKTNITPSMSNFWLSVSFIEQEVMVLQCLTITLPWVSVLNSDQVTTEPLGILQFVYWAAISLSDRTRSHMLTSASWAFSVFSSSKPPPKVSWSCPSTKWPPDRTVYPTSKPICWPSNWPFLYSLSSP